MNLFRYLLILLLLGCAGSKCIAQSRTKNTPKREWRELINTGLSGNDCKPADDQYGLGAQICKGLEGYSLLVKGDEKKPEIFLIAPDGRKDPLEYWDTSDPNYRLLNPGLLWVVVNEPKKTIAISFYVKIDANPDYGKWGYYDVIFRVNPGPVCIVASIASGSTSAGESVGIASSPGDRPCLTLNQLQQQNWFFTAQRLTGEGKVEEAKTALANIKEPSERFIIYKEIARAQVKASDLQGAHRTLLTARAEALKKPYVDGLKYTLINVTAGLAEAGYYEEAKADVPLYEEHDQLRMRLMIAWYQGERKDFEAAKATYREMIQLELHRVPRVDWNLKDICEAQARMKLYDEARNTAALIMDPDAKRTCEDYLPDQRSRPQQ